MLALSGLPILPTKLIEARTYTERMFTQLFLDSLGEEESRKAVAVEAIISREVLFGTLEEDKKDTRVDELSAWDEPRLTGFSEALAGMPEPTQEAERSFGKGKAADEGEEPEVEREFGMKLVDGKITLNEDYYRGD